MIGTVATVLINTNEMKPPVAPIALDYIAGALNAAGCTVELLDLNFAEDPFQAIHDYFKKHTVRVVGLSFRNSDDCFWPSGASFVPRLVEFVRAVREHTNAPIALGGCGFSLFSEEILEATGCDFGICGDGEQALATLLKAVERGDGFEHVPGLVRRIEKGGPTGYLHNAPQYIAPLKLSTARDHVDNRRYFQEGGQGGVETKRGCPCKCVYCADPIARGASVRVRSPGEVADEVEALLRQGIDALHLCDSEFNIPPEHGLAVCEEMIRRGLGDRVRWYAYASVIPFSDNLARAMRDAGCAGINFGADSANAQILEAYGRDHHKADIASAVRLCRKYGMAVIIDLLLGGPGETESTARETIEFMKKIGPDCVGAALGVRVYPGTEFARRVAAEGPLDSNPNVRRADRSELDAVYRADDLLRPAFYISEKLGANPARIVKDIIAGDERFFEPMDEQSVQNYNYNNNFPLVEAIRNGARGAYWDILRRMGRSSA